MFQSTKVSEKFRTVQLILSCKKFQKGAKAWVKMKREFLPRFGWFLFGKVGHKFNGINSKCVAFSSRSTATYHIIEMQYLCMQNTQSALINQPYYYTSSCLPIIFLFCYSAKKRYFPIERYMMPLFTPQNFRQRDRITWGCPRIVSKQQPNGA